MLVNTIPLVFGLKKPTNFYDTQTRELVVNFTDDLTSTKRQATKDTEVVISEYAPLVNIVYPWREFVGNSVEVYTDHVAFIPLQIEEGKPFSTCKEGVVYYYADKDKLDYRPGRFFYFTVTRLEAGVLYVLEIYMEKYPDEPYRVYAREFVFANPPDRLDLWGMQGYTEYVWGGDFQTRKVVRGFHLGLPE